MRQATARPPEAEGAMSPECALAGRDGYEGLHKDCKQIADVPLPHSRGIVLVARCSCACHRGGGVA